MTSEAIDDALAERGWTVLDLPDPTPVFAARNRLLERLRAALPPLERLEDYHHFATDDDVHVATLHDLASYYWAQDLGRTIVTANLDVVRRVAGLDLQIQRRPYLRAVRPHHPGDASPLHRDTYYGASPYEVSFVIPFTDMSDAGALCVISGSHLEPDEHYPFAQQQSPDVAIRSRKHELGFPYAPRLLDASLTARTERVPVRVGQALVFGLSLVHGGGVNTATTTRFSTDIRVVNALAPVRLSRGVDARYFVPLCDSAITRTANRYLAAQDPPA